MRSRLFIAPKVNITSFLLALLLALTACTPGGGGGGITIAQNDSTPPTLTLGAGQPGGQNISASAGGTGQSMTLVTKTGPVNLVATAVDPESGIQTVEIWVNQTITSCDANDVCQTSGPGLLGQPTFDSTSPQKQPGETTAESSIFATPLDLTTQIPQGSVSTGNTLTVDLTIFAVAVNHRGGRTQTPDLTLTWSEP
jgi:hypothetical protein